MEKILELSALQPGEQVSVVVDDTPALAIRIGDEYYVIEDVCSHDGQPLEGGTIQDTQITCPRHGARFDLKTGAALCMPATRPIRTFVVEVRDDGIWAGPAEEVPAATASSSAQSAAAPQPAAAVGSTSDPTTEGGLPMLEEQAAGKAESESVADTTQNAASDEQDSHPSTEADFLEALKQVIDPELMINIVDLGLIYAIERDEENPRRVKVDMTLTSPACPAGPQLVQQARMALERLHDVDEALINMVMSPPWTPERMTDDARDQLGIF